MFETDTKAIIQVIACICGKDGIISHLEEEKMFEVMHKEFPSLTRLDFDFELNTFFESGNQIEDYLTKITDIEAHKFTLRAAEISASADGLDWRENIALHKAKIFWGFIDG